MAYSGIPYQVVEGQSIHRPPFFDGTDYPYWKKRMEIYLSTLDFEILSIIEDGYSLPTKPKSEQTREEKSQFSLNGRTMNILYCALDRSEFNRISGCESAKAIWDMLEITHEGTSRVKESKISMLVHDYELFKMHPHEDIKDMFTRFTEITNGLKALGRVYSNADLVTKILRSLPKHWEAKVTAIREAKDLRTLPLEELLGSLMTYELEQIRNDSEGRERKKKNLALKSRRAEEEEEESIQSSENDEEFQKMAEKFKKLLSKGKHCWRYALDPIMSHWFRDIILSKYKYKISVINHKMFMINYGIAYHFAFFSVALFYFDYCNNAK